MASIPTEELVKRFLNYNINRYTGSLAAMTLLLWILGYSDLATGSFLALLLFFIIQNLSLAYREL